MRTRILDGRPTDRRTAQCGYAGEHLACPGFHEAAPEVKCSCGCHADPWPFPCADDEQ